MSDLKFEHLALNVPDSRAMSLWYVEHFAMRVVRSLEEPPYIRFLADATGRLIFEIYSNPDAPIPDYMAAHPLTLHLAFVAEDARAKQRLLQGGGAMLLNENIMPGGDVMVMMRDPWGIPLQLWQRTEAL